VAPVEVKPIHITIDVNVKVDKELDNFFSDIDEAISAGQIDAFLQPIVRIDDGRIVGVEVLARWHHPERGMVPPDVFIPVAEQTGMIERLSLLVLERACAAAARVESQLGRSLRLSFNISALQFRQPDYIGKLLSTLEAAGRAPQDFELELTESVLMEHGLNFEAFLQELRKQGIRLSIDDFGTGFSSLAYLQEIDAQVLKVDRRFVTGATQSSKGARLAASIISMARQLGLGVIAEGVETPEQLEFLRRQGCDYYQGYLYARPMAVDDLLLFLATYQ